MKPCPTYIAVVVLVLAAALVLTSMTTDPQILFALAAVLVAVLPGGGRGNSDGGDSVMPRRGKPAVSTGA